MVGKKRKTISEDDPSLLHGLFSAAASSVSTLYACSIKQKRLAESQGALAGGKAALER